MAPPLSPALAEQLRRWHQAGLIDSATAEAITAFEAHHPAAAGPEPASATTLSLTARLLLTLGAVLLAAGLLLFISAHWEGISPAGRFALVLAMVAGLHGLGAGAGRGASPALATALHGVGTVAFGAGVYLTGQIFHLAAHWPLGLLLWGLGAAAGWGLLRQWPQLALLAALLPAWLAAEWRALIEPTTAGPTGAWLFGTDQVLAAGLLLLSLAYLGAARGPLTSAPRRVLLWLGGLALGPACVVWAATTTIAPSMPAAPSLELLQPLALGWAVALGGPLLLGWWLRGRAFWPLGVAVGWLLVSVVMPVDGLAAPRFAWWALGGVLLALWGARDGRAERVNLGVVVVALTLIVFYFSEVFDKLGRSASLIGLGVLFLLGGWLLERLRRQLVQRSRLAGPPPPSRTP